MPTADKYIQHLRLQPHPEGGWFCEFYRAAESIPQSGLPDRFTGDRAFSTAIYFLLNQTEFSAFHRIRQDELWHFYDGSSLTIHQISPDGEYSTIRLGRGVQSGEAITAVVPAGRLFGATVDDASSFSLVGCTVAPGFDFADFEMPTRAQLIEQFPQHRSIIERLTSEQSRTGR
ncbi:MAG: cupin domain-containing protein [Planctomycetota bacterium]|nr:MAG: cupin domain-containing protein [Planctomycetota bacterium]REJ97734.1 MAG: cupin domain-containing protein [Planctomycetota bacterium]REK26652.1 MAG: cupin domain-containing protein [Planctomycetota bacterium]REK35689.1 MAG: cupin domain-containing protein [Planctomycetota bacterium]